MSRPEMREELVPDRHGVGVFRRWWPRPEAGGVIALVHGASEHSGRYARFAQALHGAGWAPYAIDNRGHGRTAGSTGPGRLGPPGARALVDDLDELLDAAMTEHPGVPAVVFAHSMGSLIGLAHAVEHPDRLSGLVLSGVPAPVDGLDAVAGMFGGEVADPDEPVPSLAAFNAPFEPARTPFDWLSRDETEVDRYLADELCGDAMPLTQGFVSGLFGLVAAAVAEANLSRVSCPVLVIGGDQDPAAGMGEHGRQLEAAMTRAGVAVTNRSYEGARHEVLNETNRDEVTAEVVEWLRLTVLGE